MSKVAYPFVTLAGFAAILLLLASSVGYQRGTFDLVQAFSLLRIGAVLGISGAGFSLFFILWQRPQGLTLAVITASALLGIAAFYMPYRYLLLSQRLPAIYDITTDVTNPPAFVALTRVRLASQNPVTYGGPETAVLQRNAYPDIRTLTLPASTAEIFAASMQVLDELGWRIAEANEQQGRVEATVTSRWFGFRDDVVIRLVPTGAGTTVFDMRSNSRVGVTDAGSNARHIRRFIAELNEELNDKLQ